MADYIDPNHERLQDIEDYNEATMNDFTSGMQDAIDANETAKNDALKEVSSSTAKLEDAMNKQTDFAIEEIKQQKERAEKDYTKEQSGAYADWQKQINPYGVTAEKVAASGNSGSGYAETLKVSMYNQYQARITAARESFVRLQQDYDNAMQQARLQNNSALAQIYADAAAKRAELIVQFAFKNTELLTTLAQQKATLKNQGLSNYMAVYNQLAEDKYRSDTLEEQKRQFNEEMKFKKQQYEDSVITSGGGGGGGGSSTKGNVPSAVSTPKIENKTGKSTDELKAEANKVNAINALAKANIKTANDAVKFMRKYGISNPKGFGMLDSRTWNKQKSMGTPDWQFENFNSYAEYLRCYVQTAIEQHYK